MKSILLLLASLFSYSVASGQAQKFIIDLEVGFLRFKNDSVQFQRSKTFSVSTSGCTEIFSLGKTKQFEFGMRLEILASKLSGKQTYLVGKVFYIKSNNEWQEVMKIEHQEQEVRHIAQRAKTDMFITGGGSTDYPEIFDVRLNDNYYLIP